MSDRVAARIAALIREDGLAPGAHLVAQRLADRLGVSRSPVNSALDLLARQGVLSHAANRGYFVAEASADAAWPRAMPDPVTAAYFRIADDHLRGELPEAFSEALLKQRYGLTQAQLHAVLERIGQEGWAQRRDGYGWSFSAMLTTPASLLQSYRLRLALEPAALLEPGWRIDADVLARCRAAEMHLLEGGIETDSADALHVRGVRFHEALVEGSGNPFFIETIRRVNRVRRLLSYRSTRDRARYEEHCRQHLRVLRLVEQRRMPEAAEALRRHLQTTLHNLEKIAPQLAPTGP